MRTFSRWIKAAVTAAFFYVLLRWMGRHDWGAVLRRADPIYFALSVLIVPAMLSASCAKWKVLLAAQGYDVPFRALIGYYLIGYYFSNLLPSMVGGDVVRLICAGRRIGSYSHAAAAVFLERFTGILLLLAMVVGAPALRPGLYRHPAIWVPAVGAAVLLAIFLAAMMSDRFVGRAARWMARRFESQRPSGEAPAAEGWRERARGWAKRLARKAARFFEKLAIGAGVLRRDRRTLLRVIVLTVLFYALAAVNVWLAFRTFGASPRPEAILSVLPTALTVAMIPITLGSLGITETSYVFYFGLLGVSPAHTAIMALFLRLKMILLGAVGWVVYLRQGRPVRPEDADEAGGEASQAAT